MVIGTIQATELSRSHGASLPVAIVNRGAAGLERSVNPKTFRCAKCGKVTNNHHRLRSPVYCSRRCKSEAASEAAQVVLRCDHCGKEFSRARGQTGRSAHIFCSPTCAARWKIGPNNHFYTGGGDYITPRGYVIVSVGGHRVRKCRLVAEEKLGRKLNDDEEVHHINGIRKDDDPTNLEVWSHSHPSGQRVRDKIQWAMEFLSRYGFTVVNDRDVNAARNTLIVGAGAAHKRRLRHVA